MTASDPDGDDLSFSYEASGGTISGSGKTVTFAAGDEQRTAYITVEVADNRGGSASGYVMVDIR